MQRYGEMHRHYHTARHLEECFARLDEVQPHAAEVELALWFHDAIYETSRHDNEELSAEWAHDCLVPFSSAAADRVRAMILATRHRAAPQSEDAKLTVDVDLSILGASAARFDEYDAQIRREYAWVPPALYRRERRRVLEGFLQRGAIYNTPHFLAHYEAPARANLQRALARL